MIKSTGIFLMAIFLGVSLNSCYEIQDLCLDELATNFDIAGDTACEDCCSYPTVTFQVLHKLGDVSYGQDTIVYTLTGDSLKLNRAILFIDDLSLNVIGNGKLEVQEEAVYEALDGEELTRKEDDVFITTTSSFTTLGTIRENGEVESVSGHVGIAHSDIPLEAESLLFDYDSLYVNSSYLDMKLFMKIGDSLQQDISVGIRFNDANISFQDTVLSVAKFPRENFSVKLNVNYLSLLETLEISTITEGEILNDIQLPTNFINFYR